MPYVRLKVYGRTVWLDGGPWPDWGHGRIGGMAGLATDHFVANFLERVLVKELRKSVSIWWSYEKNSVAAYFLGRLLGVDLDFSYRPDKAGLDVCPYVRPSVHKKVSPIQMWVGVQVEVDEWRTTVYGPIQGHRQGHVPLKVWNSSIFKICLLRYFQWKLASDCWFLN